MTLQSAGLSSSNVAPFPQLRAAYLRAIARAWRDPAYQERLVHASRTLPLGALPMLEFDFNFQFPFEVKFAISDMQGHRPQWMPVGTRGWFGIADRFDVYLPEKPATVDEQAAVLARYCAEFPSLLGASRRRYECEDNGGHERKKVKRARPAKQDDQHLVHPEVEAPADFAEFGVVTARIIALAWSDSDFADRLFATPDARQIVQNSMDYMVPWNFQLKFHRVEGPSNDGDDYWLEFPCSAITVFLPETPEVDVEAIALAAYNDTGSQYPFTCG